MRVVVVVIAALMTLGLAAFGIVAAQKQAGPASLVARAAHILSSASGTAAPAPAADPAPQVLAQAHRAPVMPISDAATLPSGSAPIVLAQNTATPALPPAPSVAPSGAGAATTPASLPPCGNPNALGLSRVVQIDTTGGPGFGFEHFKQYDFLRDKEVVLTFDDGPWPENTPMVIKALTDNCTKATFFEIGEHAMWHPEIARQVAAAGMTIGSHTWSHKDLARNPYASDMEKTKDEIEMGVSAVHAAIGDKLSPFFRFPDLQHPAQDLEYLAQRNMAVFSTDIDSFDFKIHKPDAVVKSVMTKLDKRGKGIILMHDFQHATAEALPELLRQLKAGGYKVVHMVAKGQQTTIAKYDDMVKAQDKLSVTNTRPESSVVKTISE